MGSATKIEAKIPTNKITTNNVTVNQGGAGWRDGEGTWGVNACIVLKYRIRANNEL